MNIKYITNVRIPTPRAHGYAIMKMCEQFAFFGAKTQLIIPDKRNNEDNQDPFNYYGIKRLFSVEKISCLDFLGYTIKFSKLFYWLDFISFFISLKLKKIIHKNDVIYTRDFVISLLFSKRNFICLELHDIPKSNFLFKIAIKKPRLFFVLNNNLKLELLKIGISENKIHVFGSGVEVKEFDINFSKKEAREKLFIPLDKKVILYSGQFYSWKGVDILAQTAKLLPEYLFIFIGGTEPELSEFKSEYGNISNIQIESFKERKIIPLYLKSADVLVIPQSNNEKISTHYSSPLKMLEYMASKRPIVASNLSSIKETLDENSAVFAEANNPLSFKLAIEKIIENPLFGEKIVANAYEKVTSYSWDNRASKILNIIKDNVSKNN